MKHIRHTAGHGASNHTTPENRGRSPLKGRYSCSRDPGKTLETRSVSCELQVHSARWAISLSKNLSRSKYARDQKVDGCLIPSVSGSLWASKDRHMHAA